MEKTKLKTIRQKKNLTQKELSDISGVPQDQISRYERGRSMTDETIRELCKALNVSADYFLGLVEEE